MQVLRVIRLTTEFWEAQIVGVEEPGKGDGQQILEESEERNEYESYGGGLSIKTKHFTSVGEIERQLQIKPKTANRFTNNKLISDFQR